MSDLTADLKEPIELVEYLYRRLHEVGVRGVHGLPGDYNLVALDYIEKCGLNWVGNVNELNAGYAADGYARIKGMSAVITTFGVGELSLLNAIAGAYAEYVPIVHIVGTPSTTSQKNGMLLHHTLGNGDFKVFGNMSAHISCAVAHLTDTGNAASLIDYTISECWRHSRPVYITLPSDMVTRKVEGSRLKTPIDLTYPDNDQEQEEYVVENVLKHLEQAKKPVILVDACAVRHRALAETHELIKKSGLPTFVTPMGKGAVDETLPNFGGVYAGNGSHPDVSSMLADSDLVLSIGSIKSDFNTAGFTFHTRDLNTIDFHSSYIKVKYSEYHNCRMNGVLKKVTERLPKLNVSTFKRPTIKPTSDSSSTIITHDWLWTNLDPWMKDGDIVITETGTAGYGIWETQFQKNAVGISQVLWGSIGYATGATQGAALAAKELGKGQRTILFTGDGSFQLSAQEVSTMIRRKLNPIIFVICNDGYTIERFIHGMEATYNDVQTWRYKDLPAAFGANEDEYKSYVIKTRDDMQKLLKDEEFASAEKLRFVELYMPKEDAPNPLKVTAEASAKNNAEQ